MRKLKCNHCLKEFMIVDEAILQCPECVQGKLIEQGLGAMGTEENVSPVEIALITGNLPQSFMDEPLHVKEGIYYSPNTNPNPSTCNEEQEQNQSEDQDQNQNQGQSQDEEKQIRLQNPPRFLISQGQEFLQLIHKVQQKQLTEDELELIFRIYSVLSSYIMIDPKTSQIIVCETLTPEEVTQFRNRLTNFIIQLTYYQCNHRRRGRLPLPLNENEVERLKKRNIIQFNVSSKFRCGICRREFDYLANSIRLDCQHRYHIPCFMKWVERCGMCPVCSRDLHP